MRFSFVNVALQALKHNSGWPEQWRNPEPKAAYDAVIIGAGVFLITWAFNFGTSVS